MADVTIFKKLFEVQILHDYFLTTVDGISFFDRDKAEKSDIISKKLLNKGYDANTLFKIEPDDATKQNLSNYKLVMAKTALGFVIGIEVSVQNKAGETLYQPRLQLKDTLNFVFTIRPEASFFKSITNISLRAPLPSIYYFTNKGKDQFDETTPTPYTSLPISNKPNIHQNGITYEMGALVDFGGTIREALQYTDGNEPSHWEDINDKRCVNNADRIVSPQNFSYSLKKSLNVTQIEFVLLDESDNEIKTITKTSTEALETVDLNFTKVDETDENSEKIPSGWYTLKITINEGVTILRTVYLNDSIYDKDNFAVVDIRFDELDSPFSLLGSEGFLKTRISAANEKIDHPIFEVRFKNRRTYWRYNKEGDFSAAEIAATTTHLAHEPEKLISIKPKALTETLVPFQNGTSMLLPYPRMPSIRIENERIFSEIFINQSNRLLNN